MNTCDITAWTACFSTRLPSIEESIRQGVCRELPLLVGDEVIVVPVSRDSLHVVYVGERCVGIAVDADGEGESFRYCWVERGMSVNFPPCSPRVIRKLFSKIGIRV